MENHDKSEQRIIGVVSGKGGVGKTTFVANVGLALTGFKKRVVVVDADISTSNLGLQLGFYHFSLGLNDVLDGSVNIADSVYTHQSGLRVIPTSLSMSYLNKKPNPYRLKSLINELNDELVFIDSPPGLDKGVFFVLKACTEVIVITNPEIPAVTDALKTIRIAKTLKKNPISIIVNRVEDSYELKNKEIEAMCDVPVIGKIPEDKMVKKSVFKQALIVQHKPHSPASVAFKTIAANLIGGMYKPPRFLKIKRIFERFR